MVLKTFNLDEKVYAEFSEFCKENGLSMSKQVNLFIQAQMSGKVGERNKLLDKLKKMRGLK